MKVRIYLVETNEFTLHAKLLIIREELLGYTTLIFEDLEYKDPDFKYITCTMFPNWDQEIMNIGDIGFLRIKYITAGKDTWFDGKNFIPYKYTNIQFLKFIKMRKQNKDLILS